MSEASGIPRRIALVGASGLVGQAIVQQIRGTGTAVEAVASTSNSRGRHSAFEFAAVDLEPSDSDAVWATELAPFDAVIHTGLPRLSAPIRRRGLRRTIPHAVSVAGRVASALPEGVPLVLASTHFVRAERDLGMVAAAVEESLWEYDHLRVVRLPWVYGPSGPVSWITRGLAARRFRVVGQGSNRFPLVSAPDAARALLAALRLPAGVYGAGQADPPTQLDVVKRLCKAGALPRPDHVPPRLATYTLGGPLADAYSFDLRADTSPELSAVGWTAADEWGASVFSATRPQGGSGGE